MYVVSVQRNQFHRDYMIAPLTGIDSLSREETKKVDEIVTMESSSTEPIPRHYVTSDRKSFQCIHLKQGTCKR